MKISIIGYSGSGKSTLCKNIANKYKINKLYLDTIHWLPNWVEKEKDLEIKELTEFLDSNTSWIIDGNYFSLLLDRRLEESDKIIILKLNRFACLHRAIKRKNRFKNKSRESITNGCEERIDFSFAMWILFTGRTYKRRKKYKDIASKYKDKCIIIRNQKELNDYYKLENIDNKYDD